MKLFWNKILILNEVLKTFDISLILATANNILMQKIRQPYKNVSHMCRSQSGLQYIVLDRIMAIQ